MDPVWFRLLPLIIPLLPLQVFSQPGSIPHLFREIKTEPQVIVCRNELEVNNRGGHLQGVQLMVGNDAEYAILSGSSSTVAYYAVARLQDPAEVQSINPLMPVPFKHAGGLQICQDLMIVGIEDNSERDKSIVCVYRIDDPDQPTVKPLSRTVRAGEAFRSTAGCAGVASIGHHYLAVVGDWDTKHLDFYLIDEHRISVCIEAFEKIYSVDTEKADRSGWMDNEWLAYQNINLFRDADEQLYLVGLGQNAERENKADLYLVEHDNLTEFTLRKLMSRTFNCREGADFRSGAGIYRQADGKLKLISCGSHIRDTLILNKFD